MIAENVVIMIYQQGTDGEVSLERLTRTEIIEKVERYELTVNDYAIIEGVVLKSFFNNTPVEKVKGMRE